LAAAVSTGVKGGEDGERLGPVGCWLVFLGLFGDEEGLEIFGSDHGVSLFFKWFGDKERVGGALGGEFAAVEAVGVVNAGGAVLTAIQTEGVGDGIEVERVGAGDTKKGAVRRN